MSLSDALVITALGMAVVFTGLILTALLISAFGLVARCEERRTTNRQTPTHSAPHLATQQVDEQILAVIAAVIEVERRLHRAESSGRLTIVRAGRAGREG